MFFFFFINKYYMNPQPKKRYWFNNNTPKTAGFKKMQQQFKTNRFQIEIRKQEKSNPTQTSLINKTPQKVNLSVNLFAKNQSFDEQRKSKQKITKKFQKMATPKQLMTVQNSQAIIRSLQIFKRWTNTSLEILNKKCQFYELISSQQYQKIGIKCFDHGSQIIFYCATDKQTLCASCMYGNKSKGNVPKSSLLDPVHKHRKHEIHEISKALSKIQEDNYSWNFIGKERAINLRENCKKWKKLQSNLHTQKEEYLKKLEHEFDRLTLQMSKKYLLAKRQIQDFTKKIDQNYNIIIQGLNSAKRLLDSRRFVLPVIKHIWNITATKFYQDFKKQNMENELQKLQKIGKQKLQYYLHAFLSEYR